MTSNGAPSLGADTCPAPQSLSAECAPPPHSTLPTWTPVANVGVVMAYPTWAWGGQGLGGRTRAILASRWPSTPHSSCSHMATSSCRLSATTATKINVNHPPPKPLPPLPSFSRPLPLPCPLPPPAPHPLPGDWQTSLPPRASLSGSLPLYCLSSLLLRPHNQYITCAHGRLGMRLPLSSHSDLHEWVQFPPLAFRVWCYQGPLPWQHSPSPVYPGSV